MSDQFVQGTTDQQDVEQTSEQEVPAPSYLTKEEAEQLFQKKVDEALSRQVGLYTQGTEKLRQRLAALEDNLQMQRDSGITIDEATADRMRNKIITKTLTEKDEEQSQARSADAQPNSRTDAIDPQRVNGMAAAILQNMGVTFEEGSPEIKMIKMNGSPFEYLESITLAASAWKKRTSEKPNPEARIPGLVGGTGQAKQDWQAEYRKEITEAQKDPISGVEKALQVRRKYRGLGHTV